MNNRTNQIEDAKVTILWSLLGYFIFDSVAKTAASMFGVDYKVAGIVMVIAIIASIKYGIFDSLFGNGL